MRSLKKKIPAGALQFVLFTAAIIALLLLAAVLLFYTHRYFITQSDYRLQTMLVADRAIHKTALLEISPDTLALPMDDTDDAIQVSANLSRWGIFTKAFVKSRHRKKVFTRCGLIGSGTDPVPPSLYLQQSGLPLVVAGNTRIEGPVALPPQGVRTGNINGHSYYNSQMVYGSITASDTLLPPLTAGTENYLWYYLREYEPVQGDIVDIHQEKQLQSFHRPVKGFYSPSAIDLRKVRLSGNIIIRSDTRITVYRDADLHDVILAAPEIEIKTGVNGNFQAIADNRIIVGDSCRLDYPSALVLLENIDNQQQSLGTTGDPGIQVGEKVSLSGSVCYFGGDTAAGDYRVNVYLAGSSLINGEIYCRGMLESRGTVTGSVYAGYLGVRQGGRLFINHLYDANINSENLPRAFGGIPFENRPKTVLKWLY